MNLIYYISSNLLTIGNKPIEGLYVELNLRKLIFDKLSESLDLFSADYEKVIFLGDFNVGVNDNHIKFFCENYTGVFRSIWTAVYRFWAHLIWTSKLGKPGKKALAL